MGTKNSPGVYDCYANAEPDEPMFVLLGRDERAPALVEAWADASVRKGTSPAKIAEARACAAAMRAWRADPESETLGTASAIVDQPPPAPSSGPAIWPAVIADVARVRHGDELLGLVLADMRQRHQLGIERGTAPQAGNGRDALVDAYQEALDLCAYLRQGQEEGIADAAELYAVAIDLAFALRGPILVRAGSRGTAARDAAHGEEVPRG